MTVSLASPLDVEACRQRLVSEIGSWWPLFARHTIFGRVNEQGFQVRKALHYGNPMQILARGTWQPILTGTRICVRLGPSRGYIVYMGIWLASAVIFNIGWLVQLAHNLAKPHPRVNLWWCVFPLLFPALGVAQTLFQRWLARREAGFLIATLARTLACTAAGVDDVGSIALRPYAGIEEPVLSNSAVSQREVVGKLHS